MEIIIKDNEMSEGQINALREHLIDFFQVDLQIEVLDKTNIKMVGKWKKH